MTLLVDLGNSALKWAWFEGGTFTQRGRVSLHEFDSERDLEKIWGVLSTPPRILVASVAASAVTDRIARWCEQRWHSDTVRVVAQADGFGVRNAYREPTRLGVDRWLALVAARARVEGATCVVDCGSAVTIDVLDECGVHLGGLIVPGLEMMKSSLLNCAQIALNGDPDSEIALLARDTNNAVLGGTLYAAVAFIDRVVADVGSELTQTMQQFITGGDATTLLPLLQHSFEHVPDLVLEGLAVVAQETECVS